MPLDQSYGKGMAVVQALMVIVELLEGVVL